MTWWTGWLRNAQGTALASVLALLLLVAGAAASFVWLQNQQQASAGRRYRADAAIALAEAGVHRALAVLEGAAPDGAGPGRAWWPAASSETLRVGGFMGTLARLTPHSYAHEGYYRVMAENAAFSQVLPEIGILLAFGIVFFLIAVWRFRYD